MSENLCGNAIKCTILYSRLCFILSGIFMAFILCFYLEETIDFNKKTFICNGLLNFRVKSVLFIINF